MLSSPCHPWCPCSPSSVTYPTTSSARQPGISPLRGLALAFALALALVGCASKNDARADLVPYPKLGDSATYDITGAYVELARWENAHPVEGATKLRFDVAAGPRVVDAA